MNQHTDLPDISREELQLGATRRTMDGAFAMLCGRVGLTLVQVVAMVVLARLLLPEAFGLVAMIAPIAAIMATLKDAGLSTATTQAKCLSHDQASTLFWLNVTLGCLFAAGFGLAAPLIADFMRRDELRQIVPAFAGMLFISSLSGQHGALLRRSLQFNKLAILQVSVAAFSAVIAVIAAFAGADYWSLILMAYANAIGNVVATWLAVRWRPGRPKRQIGLRNLVRFGGYTAAAHLMNAASDGLAPIVVGRSIGAGGVGLLNRASRLTEQFVDQLASPLSQVVLPTLARIQDDRERSRRAIRQVIEKTALLTFGLAGLLVVAGESVVLLLLGQGWEEAGLIVRILAIGSIIWSITRLLEAVVIGQGHAREMFYWTGVNLALKLFAIVIGSRWGLVGVATAIALANWLGFMFLVAFAKRFLPLDLAGLIQAGRPAGIAVMAAIALCAVINKWISFETPLLTMLLLSSVYVAGYVFAILLQADGRRLARETYGAVHGTLGVVGR
jgi:PST family polysaccharide transporter